MDTNLVEIFYLVDEFCKEFDKVKKRHILKKDCNKKSRNRKFTMPDSEVITILIYFHLKQYKNLKLFYINHVQAHWKEYFPKTVSYNCFVELQQKALLPMTTFLQLCCLGKCTGISYIDSTPLRVCHIKRKYSHKTFKGLATKNKTSTGWTIGFKLNSQVIPKEKVGEVLTWVHIAISNAKRQILNTFHDVKPEFLQKYLDEFCYKFNRRYFGEALFNHLLVACVSYKNEFRYIYG